MRIGCNRPSHELKSPTTETERALGAQFDYLPAYEFLARLYYSQKNLDAALKPSYADLRMQTSPAPQTMAGPFLRCWRISLFGTSA